MERIALAKCGRCPLLYQRSQNHVTPRLFTSGVVREDVEADGRQILKAARREAPDFSEPWKA